MPNENYAMMTECERIGIGGGCGVDCSVFIRGDCDEEAYAILGQPETTPNDDYERAMEILS